MDSKNQRAGQWFHSVHAAGTGQNIVHCAHFLDESVKLIPNEIVSFGKKVDEVDQTEDEVKITFHDGSIATASAVIGCDGIKKVKYASCCWAKPTSQHTQSSPENKSLPRTGFPWRELSICLATN